MGQEVSYMDLATEPPMELIGFEASVRCESIHLICVMEIPGWRFNIKYCLN